MSLHLQEIHRLRGVAILMIVAAHCYQFFGWTSHPFAEAIFKDVFDNSSVIFIFIAGFLFQYLEERRFSATNYFLRKAKTVFLPYIIALVPALVYANLRGSRAFAQLPPRDFSASAQIFYQVIYPGVTINYALWFIPVIAVYYLGHHYLERLIRDSTIG